MYSYLPVPGNTEGVGRHFGTFILLEQTGSRIAQVQTEITISGLCQQIDTYRIDIHVFAHSLLFSAVDVGERFYAVADFNLRTYVEEKFVASSQPLLPLQCDRNTEEEMAEPAAAVAVFFVAFSKIGLSVGFEQGPVAVETE